MTGTSTPGMLPSGAMAGPSGRPRSRRLPSEGPRCGPREDAIAERTDLDVSAGAEVPGALVRLEVLGAPVVRWGERAVAFRTRRELALLVYLALTGVPQPRERLAALLWPDRHPEAGRALLRRALSLLRHDLAAAGRVTPDELTAVTTGRDTFGREVVGLARDAFPVVALDAHRLASAAARMAPLAVSDVVPSELVEAVAAYRGLFLEGLDFDDAPGFQDWVDAQRLDWQRQAESVMARLARAQLARRAPEDALVTGRRWLAVNPVSEPAYRVVMRALGELGDRAGALAAYAEARSVLEAQLGVEPTPETATLAEGLRHAPEFAAKHSGGAATDPGGREWALDPRAPPFVGRGNEFARLVEAYRAAHGGWLQVVVIEGEAGIGKTRLAGEFARWATLEGADVLHGQGYPAHATLPYQPLVDALRPRLDRERAPDDLLADVWLAELVRLFPELHERYPDLPLPAALPPADPTAQSRLYEAMGQLLRALGARAQAEGLVLLCDDAQWVDQATREFLQYWAKRQMQEGGTHLLIMTLRSGAADANQDLGSWLETLERVAPVIRITLGPLSRDETAQIVRAWLDREATAEDGMANQADADTLTSRLYAQTEGQPFYLVETLGALTDQGAPVGSVDLDRRAVIIPGRVRDLIRGQLAGLGPTARELAGALAVLGSAASFQRLVAVAELDESAALVTLDELRRRQLVVEQVDDRRRGSGAAASAPVIRFPHELVHEVVYTELGETRRLVLHRRGLATLEKEDVPAAELARHALAAGLTEPAFRYSVAAGDAALTVCAARDALAHYERARELLEELEARRSPAGANEWAYLHEQLGRAYVWVGSWDRARSAFEALNRHARAVGDAKLEGIALTRLALFTWWETSDMPASRALAARAVEVAKSTAGGDLLAQAHWVAGFLAFVAGDPMTARSHGKKAEEIGRALGREELVAGGTQLQAQAAVRVGDWTEAIAAFHRTRALFMNLTKRKSAGSPAADEPSANGLSIAYLPWLGVGAGATYYFAAAHCAAWEGLAEICRGQPRRAVELGQEALRLRLDEPGSVWEEPYGAWALTMGLVEAGTYGEALQIGQVAFDRALGVTLPPDVRIRPLVFWAQAQQAVLDLDQAERAVDEAVTRAERLGTRASLVVPHSLRCVNLVLSGGWTSACDAARRAVSARELLPERLVTFDFSRHVEIAALVRGGERALAAAEICRLAERLRDDGSDRRYWLVYRRMQAALARGDEDIASVRWYLAEALELATAIGLPGQEWEILAELAEAHRESGDEAAAEAALDRSLATVAALAQSIDDEQVRELFRARAEGRARSLATRPSPRARPGARDEEPAQYESR